MRRDTTPDNGASLELHTWLITLCVLAVSALLQYAITLHQSDKGEASGEDHFKPYVLTAMQSKAVRSDINEGGKGVRKYKEDMCISLQLRNARF